VVERPRGAILVQSLTDEELMVRVQQGDLLSFELLVERMKGTVYSLAISMLRSREDAEEAAQDTFVKLFRARDQFDRDRALEPWLLRIAGNTCRDMLRRRRATRPPAASLLGEVARLIPDPATSDYEGREATRQAVRHQLDLLSERLRLPLVLKYRNGLTNQQVADALGISISNVKVRVARAKDVLQSRLDEAMES
jgi:RNA polymerase sigma factor (sigma-70 family)